MAENMLEKLKNLECCHEILDYVFHGGISKENQTQIAGAMYFLEKYMRDEEARIAQAEAIIKAKEEQPKMLDRLVSVENNDCCIPRGRTCVLFSIPESVTDAELMDTIHGYIGPAPLSPTSNLERICTNVCRILHGTWQYMRQAGTIYCEEE